MKDTLTIKGALILLAYIIGMVAFWMWFSWYPMWTWRLNQYNMWDSPWLLPPASLWMNGIYYGWFVVLVVGLGFIVWKYTEK